MDVLAELLRDDDLILHGVRDLAATDGDRPFLASGADGVELSYGAFDELTRRVANGLHGLGIRPGDRVSVFTRRAYTSVVSMFSIWRGGFVYSPVNFNLQGDLLAYQIADTQPAAIICEDRLLEVLVPALAGLDPAPAVIVVGSTDDESVGTGSGIRLSWDEMLGDDREPNVDRTPHDIANLVYTSGTTGRPKGVLLPYRWMNQYTFLLRRMLAPTDVVYNDLPLYHIGGAVANVARAAWAGASVALWDKFSPSEFWGRIEQSGATLAILLDVMIPWLMSAPADERDRHNTLNKVHMQPFPLYHHEVAERFGIDWVLVGFGQTETGSVAAGLIDEFESGQGTPAELYRGRTRKELTTLFDACDLPVVPGTTTLRKGFMGREAPYVEVAVLDGDDEPRPDGEQGELGVRPRLPSLLLREYHGRPEATLEATRNQWFHTGDIVFRGEDGYLYFVDRSGDRIRTRGENVSSLQLEDLLTAMPKAAMCAVLPVPADEGLEHDIAAFVVPEDGAALTSDEVIAWARENLPRFMRPRHVRVIPELPKTPTNKIEKYRLRADLLAEIGSG